MIRRRIGPVDGDWVAQQVCWVCHRRREVQVKPLSGRKIALRSAEVKLLAAYRHIGGTPVYCHRPATVGIISREGKQFNTSTTQSEARVYVQYGLSISSPR